MFQRIIKRDIYDQFGELVIPANTLLTKKELKWLKHHNIILRKSDYIVSVSPHVDASMQELKEALKFGNKEESFPLERIRTGILPILNEIVFYPNQKYLLSFLESIDEYTMRHSISVAILSRFIGKSIGIQKEELDELTIAALLHDIGKLRVPESILKKSGKLTESEFAMMAEHTIHGFEIVRRLSGCTYRQALVALQHHEREDGSGYPHRLHGFQIDPLSKIVAVADVFHAMVSKRVYKEPVPLYQVLKELSLCANKSLEPNVTLNFLTQIMNLIHGSRVTLSNGESGRIVMIHKEDPIHPVVEVNESYIDLSRIHSVMLEQVL